jgi:hypothetical protein
MFLGKLKTRLVRMFAGWRIWNFLLDNPADEADYSYFKKAAQAINDCLKLEVKASSFTGKVADFYHEDLDKLELNIRIFENSMRTGKTINLDYLSVPSEQRLFNWYLKNKDTDLNEALAVLKQALEDLASTLQETERKDTTALRRKYAPLAKDIEVLVKVFTEIIHNE